MLHGYTGKRRSSCLKGLQSLIDRHPVISFDIFDTLIRRDAAAPPSVFTMMERELDRQYGKRSHFAEKRLLAEQRARAELVDSGVQEEVTLTDIYMRLSEPDLNSQMLRELAGMEQRWEEALAEPDPDLKKVWDYCLRRNKTVVLVSDMYLPADCVRRMLAKCGYAVAEGHLFLSSGEMCTKRRGGLYRRVCERLNLTPSDVLHIGDNFMSDGIQAVLAGLQVFPVSRDVQRGDFFNDRGFRTDALREDYRSLCRFTDNHAACLPYYRRMGYSLLGPLLYGFSRWLERKTAEDGIEHLFFLARDGALLDKAFSRSIRNGCGHSYLYASRRALIVPTLRSCSTAEELSRRMFWPVYGTMHVFLKQIGLDAGSCGQELADCGLDPDRVYPLRSMIQDGRLNGFFDRISGRMQANAEEEYGLLTEYLRQSRFTGKIGIVDIGWHGNMQRALLDAAESAGIPAEIRGYYVGLNPDAAAMGGRTIRGAGYLFGPGEREDEYARMQNFVPLFEFFFGAAHGSTERFERDADLRIVPRLADPEYEPDSREARAVQELQAGALACLADLADKQEFSLMWEPETVFRNFSLLGNAPDLEAIRRFGSFRISDGENRILAPAADPPAVLHPVSLLAALKESGWRIATLRGSFRSERLPGYELISAVRRAAEKGKRI